MSKAQRVAFTNSIADDCKLPRSAFAIRQDGDLNFKPEPSAPYTPVMCGVRKLMDVHALKKIGFISQPAVAAKKK